MAEPRSVDIVVVGGGPAGLAAALSLAKAGATTTLVAAPHRPAGNAPDMRTAALFTGSIELLRNLGCWSGCHSASESLAGIRLVDRTDGLLRAPEITFRANEIGLSRFGYNVPQGPLVSTLEGVAAQQVPAITRTDSTGVARVEPVGDHILLVLNEGVTLSARLVVAADGRNSVCRKGAGIECQASNYEQTAIACTFMHTRPHHNISTEFHRRPGPLTTVPLPGRHSSLVWVERPHVARHLIQLGDRAFLSTLERQLDGLLGTLSDVSPRASFPLTTQKAAKMAANRVALIGEAGHVMPPIGAQGLNLSLRDVAVLADLIAETTSQAGDPGAPELLSRYDKLRRGDVRLRGTMVDVLNRTLTSPLPPVQLARGLGLHALNAVAPLRQRMIREGLHPTGPLPTLMRPQENDPPAIAIRQAPG